MRDFVTINELTDHVRAKNVHTRESMYGVLKRNGYLVSHGATENLPSKKSVADGIMETRERRYTSYDGTVKKYRYAVLTRSGAKRVKDGIAKGSIII